jgi:acetyl-CoA synthetase
MKVKKIPAKEGTYNLQDYEKMRETFSWNQVNEMFSWHETGNVNMAYEAIDRHAENPDKSDQIALLYSSPDREEKLTFSDLRNGSNKFANVLRKYGINKGDRVFSIYA